MSADFLPNAGREEDLDWINKPAEVNDEDVLARIMADIVDFDTKAEMIKERARSENRPLTEDAQEENARVEELSGQFVDIEISMKDRMGKFK